MAKRKLTKAELAERDERHARMTVNAQRLRELAARAHVKLDPEREQK